MKKVFALVLVIVFLLCFVASCDSSLSPEAADISETVIEKDPDRTEADISDKTVSDEQTVGEEPVSVAPADQTGDIAETEQMTDPVYMSDYNKYRIREAFEKDAVEYIVNAKKPYIADAKVDWNNTENDYPETYDLRAVDTDGDGQTENYVTSVKYQNPFGTCWAFAAVSAAETSILYELGEESVAVDKNGNEKDAIDLSEHQLAWFTYTPMPEGDSQEGEGLYSMADGVDENPSERMNSGSTQFAASTVFASGMGPLLEPDFETAEEPESALNYHGKDFKTEYNEKKKNYNYSIDDDWSVDESQRFRQSYMLEDSYFLPSPVSFGSDGTYDIDHADAVGKMYKNQMMNGRPVSIGFCSDNYSPSKINAAAKYIDTETYAHYCYEKVRSNHAVTIIGWDDNYPKENFLSEVQVRDTDGNLVFDSKGNPVMRKVSQPPKNGAWIVKNSWGSIDSIGQGLNENHWGVDDTGYFYLSYYDRSIETAQCFDFDVENKLKADLGKYVIEENDFLPTEVPHCINADFPVSMANAFVAEENETVKAVSCTSIVADEKTDFAIYVIDSNKPVPSADDKPAVVFSETFEFPGLHLVKVPKPVSVKKGEKVVVMCTQKDDDGYYLCIGSEYNEKAYNQGFCDDDYAAKAVVNPGESFIYLSDEGEWMDFSEAKEELESTAATSYFSYDNFPIKLFASINN